MNQKQSPTKSQSIDVSGSMQRRLYRVSSGADGEACPVSGGKVCGKPDIACQAPREERNFASYSARAIWSVIQFICSEQNAMHYWKRAVFVVLSYFKHTFIII
ncbi:hypothetical protein PVAP13_8KG359004 [Panicum virgatum]|uniref:Uncharacterized protein n=1 Tax=Panicum virgatum TaxID=38727 RepID=A0A8T0PNB9_PANVG|nr:hypothetical protein PVAP13_8KG359004 [Panicum virgatum]